MIAYGVAAGVLVVALAQGALAQDDPLGEAMARDPEKLLEDTVDLIAGFGTAAGLTADGIEAHIGVQRAGARALALRRFLAMDLNADGTLDRDELAVSQGAASAAARGRMERQFRTADSNGDARVDATEQAAEGRAAALRAVSEVEAQLLRSLVRLDADGDGALTTQEVEAALAAKPSDT